MAQSRVLRELISSHWLHAGAKTFFIMAFFQWMPYITTGIWFNLTPMWWFLLLFVAGAALELWLKTNSAKAIMAPITARLDKSRIWREFNKPLIGNSQSLTVIVIVLMGAAMWAVMLAAMVCILHGFNGGALDAFLAGWPLLAIMVGCGALWLMLYHAGINPSGRAFEFLYFAGVMGLGALILFKFIA